MSKNKEVCFPLCAWEIYVSYSACGSHPYKPLMKVWWTTEVRLPIFFFFPLQLHTLPFIDYQMRYLVESKLICTARYFVKGMLSYDSDWHSIKSRYERNESIKLFKPRWDTASSAHEEFTWALLMWKLTSEVSQMNCTWKVLKRSLWSLVQV